MSKLRVLRRNIVAAAVAVLAGVACSGAPADAVITGVVTRGPMCPVVQEGQSCPDMPTSGTVRLVDTSGDEAARTEADDEGRFELAVPAGTYRLEADVEEAMSCSPIDLSIAANQSLEVDITCDTGIR